jgi:hypothetical protein
VGKPGKSAEEIVASAVHGSRRASAERLADELLRDIANPKRVPVELPARSNLADVQDMLLRFHFQQVVSQALSLRVPASTDVDDNEDPVPIDWLPTGVPLTTPIIRALNKQYAVASDKPHAVVRMFEPNKVVGFLRNHLATFLHARTATTREPPGPWGYDFTVITEREGLVVYVSLACFLRWDQFGSVLTDPAVGRLQPGDYRFGANAPDGTRWRWRDKFHIPPTTTAHFRAT